MMPVTAYSTPIETADGGFPDVCDDPPSTEVLFKRRAADEICPSISKAINVSIVSLVVFLMVKYVAYGPISEIAQWAELRLYRTTALGFWRMMSSMTPLGGIFEMFVFGSHETREDLRD